MSTIKRLFSVIMTVVFAAGVLFNPLSTSVKAAAAPVSDTAVPKSVIFPYNQPAKYAASVNYTLKANGVDIPVIKAFDDYDYANFSMSNGPVTYEVTILNTDKVHEYEISPKKLGIQPDSIVGRTLTFTTQKDEYLIVTMNGRKTRLVIAADPAETDIPASTGAGIFNIGQSPYQVSPTGSQTGVEARTAAIQQAIDDASHYGTNAGNSVQGVVYIPAGQYYIGNLVLKSNTALYMQPGSTFIGTGKTADYKEHWYKDSMGRPATWWISTAFDSTNIKLYGRGTIDGNGAALYADKSINGKGMINNLVVPIATSNFKMDGIIIRESASWAVTPIRSHDLSFTNMKFFNSLGMGENDGIDVCESQNVVVKNAIGIALDDPFSTKSWKETTDIASGKVPWPGNPQPVSNVLFEDAISWTLCYGFKIGQGVMQNQNNIIFRDGVVYKAAVGFAIHHKYGSGTVSNVIFENMDVEDISGFNEDNSAWMTLFTVNGSNSGVGSITGITVKNIKVRDAGEGVAKIKGLPDAPISGITFENVYMPGKTEPATNLYEMNFANKDNYSDISIKPIQNPEPRPQTNLALNQPAVASSNDSTVDTAPWAFDGDMSTRFGSKRGIDPGWIYVDLGAIKSINEVRLYWETAYAKSYQIQVSNDLQTWNNVYNTTTGKGLYEKITFNQTDARYVRMYGTVRATQYGYSVWEFEVYGPEVFPENITLNKTALVFLPGETEPLTAVVMPANTTNNKVKWSSSNANVAVVDNSGLVTAIGLGVASITAKTANGEFKATATVNVAELNKPQLQSAIAGNGYVNLSWSKVERATNYRIYSSTSAGSYGSPIATVGDNVYTYKAEELSNGTTYYFVIKAVRAERESDVSNELLVVPQISTPGAPQVTSAVPGNAQVRLSWVPMDDVTNYHIFVSTKSGEYSSKIATVSGSVYKYDAVNLNNGATYYFIIKAGNPGGLSEASNEVIAIPQAPTPTAPVFEIPVAGNAQVVLIWKPVNDSTGYKVYQSVNSSTNGAVVASVSSSVYSYKVTGLTNGTTYYFVVKAINAGGESAASNIVSATPQGPIPTSPVLETPVTGNAQVALTWKPVNDSTGYRVYKSVNSSTNGTEVATVSGSVHSYKVTGLTNGTTYYFVVKAINAGGESAASNIVSAMPKTVPGAPTGITAAAGNSQAIISFNDPSDNGGSAITGYEVTTTPGNTIVTGTTSPITITGLSNGLTYTFTVKTINSEGSSAPSDVSNEVTPRAFSNNNSSSNNSGGSTSSSDNTLTSTDGILTLPIGKNGMVSLGEGITIVIPTDVTDKELKITIDKVLDIQSLLMNQDVLVSSIFEIMKNFPDNFNKPVTLTLTFDPESVSSLQRAAIFYYDEIKNVWVEVEGSKVNGSTITVEVNHFTKFAVFAVSETASTEPKPSLTFTDIMGHWAEANIKHAVSGAIVTGYPDGTFKPNHTVTRAEFAVMLMNTLKLQGEGTKLSFIDTAKIGTWAQKAVAQAVQAGIIYGYEDGSFRPDTEITRAEMAVLLANARGQQSEANVATGFADDRSIPAWAKGSVAYVKQAGIVQGKGANEYAPQDHTTRAEAVTVLLNMLAQKSK
ncbi:fibronectin type III domain-containing protein [Paenibacillus sp. FSL H7-0331]|uniref:fibronectin type III domain-containing protein n=1 Tax=Paenibacillus sp. FSL H7-0331 TaxID=1920421 RepID=UPI00117E6869|nr:S-layer homology domain-containing protein [Paenibacillus sp. FSL H7-0331]